MIKEFALHILNRWALSFLELLAFFPIVLVISIVIAPFMNLWLFVLSLSTSYIIGIIFGKIAPSARRNLILILGFGFILFAAYRMHGETYAWILHALIFFVLYFRGFKSSEADASEWFPMQIFFVSYLLHFAVIFYFSRVHELEHYLPHLAVSVFLNIIVSLIFMNFKQLKYAALSGTSDFSPPAGMIRRNIAMVALILILLFSISYFRNIRESITWLWNAITGAISSILAYLSALLRGDNAEPALPIPEDMLPPDLEAPLRDVNPIWLAIIEFISTILLFAIILAIALLLLKSFYLLLRAVIRSLFQYNKNDSWDSSGEDSGFEDQKESLLDLAKLKDGYLNRLRAIMDAFLKREKKWQDLSGNIEKIRFLYKYTIVKYAAAGYRFKTHLTPAESAKDAALWKKSDSPDMAEISALYSSARYGNKDAGDIKVNEIKEKILDQQDI